MEGNKERNCRAQKIGESRKKGKTSKLGLLWIIWTCLGCLGCEMCGLYSFILAFVPMDYVGTIFQLCILYILYMCIYLYIYIHNITTEVSHLCIHFVQLLP